MSNPLRYKVKQLYKNLLHLGKDYPAGQEYFKKRLKASFMKNQDVTDEREIKLLIAKGNYVVKEIETLYMLKKYRAMKKRYYDDINGQKNDPS